MSTDDQQWQRQEEQRLAHERAQHAESERQARVQEERLEQERQDREEQDREMRQNAHPSLPDDDTAVRAERRTIWGILFGKREPGEDASVMTQTQQAETFNPPYFGSTAAQAPLGGVQKDKRSRAFSLVLLAVSAAMIGGGLWLYQSRKADKTFSGAEPSLVGVAPAIPGTPPADAQQPLPSTETPPVTDADASISSAETLPALAPLPADETAAETVDTFAVAQADTAAPSSATPEADVGLPALAPDIPTESLAPVVPLPTIEQRIGQLEAQFEQLRQMLAQRPAPVQPRVVPKRKTPRKAAPVTVQAAPKYNPRLLSVDLWDGKPSVVVATDEPGDTRTRILQPGDTLNGITLREASVAGRSASFDVGDGKLVRLGVEGQ